MPAAPDPLAAPRAGSATHAGHRFATLTLVNSTFARTVSALSLAGSMALLGGCATMSPVQTDFPYTVSDGINLDMGPDYDVRNLLIVGGEEDAAPGVLVGQFINRSAQPVTVTFTTPQGAPATAEVPAFGHLNLADERVVLSAVPGKAGDLVPLSIQTGAGTDVAQVPLLLPQGRYAELTP